MSTRNRMANLDNKYQGKFRRVLCVCSAGMLRSPTVAWVLSQEPYNFNTRAVGINKEYALIPIDEAMVFWADDVIVFDHDIENAVNTIIENSSWKDDFERPNIFVWKIPDMFDFRDPKLIEKIKVFAEKEYKRPGFVFEDLEDDLLRYNCKCCDAMWYDELEFCPVCNHRYTEE